MIRFLQGLLAGLLLGWGSLVWLAGSYHLVTTGEGLRLVGRTRTSFQLIYVDVRDWGFTDYLRHPELSKALARAGWGEARQAMERRLDDAVGVVEKELDRLRGK